MPTGGSFGGDGGADLNLVAEFLGVNSIVDGYEKLSEEMRQAKKDISEAEMKAAEIFRENAAQAAASVKTAEDVGKSGKDVSGKIASESTRILTEMGTMGTALTSLRDVQKSISTGVFGPPPEKKPPKEPRTQLENQVRGFVNVGEQATTAMNATISRVTSQMPFGIGGFVGLMLYGVAYEDKIKTEVEMYRQQWDATVQSTSSAGFHQAKTVATKLSQHIVDLTETYRLSKEEAGALVGVMSRSGITALEASSKTNIVVAGARASVFDATAAMDQVLRLQSGTAMSMATQIVMKYGGSISQAVDQVGRLATQSKESGIGVQDFLNQAMSAAGSLRMYGSDMDEALQIGEILKNQLDEQDLKPHMAGALAMMATGQAAAGIAGLSKGILITIAQQMGLGVDIAGYQVLMDQMMDPARGPGKALEVLNTFLGMVSAGRDLTRDEAATALEILAPQIGPQSAGILVDAAATLRSATATKEQKQEAQKQFNDAWGRERSRTEDWRVTFKDLMRGMSKVGLGLFTMMTAGLAELIIIFRSIPLYLVEYTGNLAKKWGVDLSKTPSVVQDIVEWVGNAEVMGVPAFGLAGLAAKGLTRKLNPQEKAQKKQLQASWDKAYASNMRGIDLLRQGGSEVLGALKQGGQQVAGIAPGVNALAGSLGTPEGMRRVAQQTPLMGTTAMLRAAGLHGQGGGGSSFDLDPGDRTALADATSQGNMSRLQDILLSAAEEEDAAFRTSQWDREELVVTSAQFEPQPDGSVRVRIHYEQVPGGADSMVNQAAERIRRPALPTGHEEVAALREEFAGRNGTADRRRDFVLRVADAYRKAGAPEAAIPLLTAHSAQATGFGNKVWNNNIGVIRSQKGWEGPYARLHTKEWLNNQYETQKSQGWRAYNSLEDSAADTLQYMEKRAPGAWRELIKGDPEAFYTAMGRAHYFTEPAEKIVPGYVQKVGMVNKILGNQ